MHGRRIRLRLGAAPLVLLALVATTTPTPALAGATPRPIVVNSTGDGADLSGGSGTCDASILPGATCTLRAAIQTANADPDEDRIHFAIPGTGPRVIEPGIDLPFIDEPLIIDGTTQSGSTVNTRTNGSNAKLRIALLGDGTFPGLVALAPTRIKGLVVSGFETAITLGSQSGGSIISGSFIGTTPDGMGLAPNTSSGIVCACADLRIGGTAKAARMIISGNLTGVFIAMQTDERVVIQGTLVGVGADGVTNLGNEVSGLRIRGTGTVLVGGDTRSAANVIAYNGGAGIAVGFADAEPTGITVARNSIYANGGLGIDLGDNGPTSNDPAPDADTGPNHRQNFPGVNSAVTKAGVTTIKGSLVSVPGRTYVLRFYSTAAGGGEGRTYLGKKSVFTKPGGSVAFTFKPASTVPAGRVITVTATQTVTGDTSEFSVARTVNAP